MIKVSPTQLEILLAHREGPRPFVVKTAPSTRVLLLRRLIRFESKARRATRLTPAGREALQEIHSPTTAPGSEA